MGLTKTVIWTLVNISSMAFVLAQIVHNMLNDLIRSFFGLTYSTLRYTKSY